MSHLLNRGQVELFALHRAGLRAHKFTRVGNDFYVKRDAHLREFIQNYIHRLPSKGKTILRTNGRHGLMGPGRPSNLQSINSQ